MLDLRTEMSTKDKAYASLLACDKKPISVNPKSQYISPVSFLYLLKLAIDSPDVSATISRLRPR